MMRSDSTMRGLRRAALVLLAPLALAACGGGDEPETPAPQPGIPASLSVSPHDGPVGTDVQLTLQGFPPDTRVDIGFGPPDSEYSVLRTATTSGNGTLDTTATVPSWAESGRRYVFVVADNVDQEPKAISGTFTVR